MKVNIPYLKAIILESGRKSPVEWIDIDEKICCTKSGYEAPIGDFAFEDCRDYDALRGEYAGRAMQAQLTGICARSIKGADAEEYVKLLPKMIAREAVKYADELIAELKKPHSLDYFIPMLKK